MREDYVSAKSHGGTCVKVKWKTPNRWKIKRRLGRTRVALKAYSLLRRRRAEKPTPWILSSC